MANRWWAGALILLAVLVLLAAGWVAVALPTAITESWSAYGRTAIALVLKISDIRSASPSWRAAG